MQLRVVLPSELRSDEVSVLNTLRTHFSDCESDLTKTVKILEKDPASLDALARIVLAETDAIVGWSVVEAWRPTERSACTLVNTFVRPDLRGQGIGRKLAERADRLWPEVSNVPPDFSLGDIGRDFYRHVLPWRFEVAEVVEREGG